MVKTALTRIERLTGYRESGQHAGVLLLCLCVVISLSACAGRSIEQPPSDPTKAYGNQLGAIPYTVKTGDNLVLIAADITRERENWRRIADFNRITNPALLKVGQQIFIPRDLIPLFRDEQDTREVAGHPEAQVKAVEPRPAIKPSALD